MRDLTIHPDWSPHRARNHITRNWVVDTWEEPAVPGDLSLDGSLVAQHGNTLRLAAIDSAANPHVAHPVHTALTAVHTIRGWLASESDLTEAIAGANRALNDPALRPRQRNPFAACAVIDINTLTGTAYAAQYADCEIWVRQHDNWLPLFTEDMFTPFARQAHDVAETLVTRGSRDWWTWQEGALDDPDVWNNPAIGWATHLRPNTVTLDHVDEVIVTTDGANLTPERCEHLTEWLTGSAQQAPDDWPHPSPHGDLTVLHARRVASGHDLSLIPLWDAPATR